MFTPHDPANTIPIMSSNFSNDLLFGDPRRFAIQSCISQMCPGRGQMGLGLFVIHLEGFTYGVARPDATLLACSFYSVLERVENRGAHLALFTDELGGEMIAQAFYNMNYGGRYADDELMELYGPDLIGVLTQNKIQWAPDGDEAFDDGSFILQFDSGSKVRLIGFRVDEDGSIDPACLRDRWLDADEFYAVLQGWSSAFLAEWEASSE